MAKCGRTNESEMRNNEVKKNRTMMDEVRQRRKEVMAKRKRMNEIETTNKRVNTLQEFLLLHMLPESLLLHTLSFLKTKEALRTSLVSKHWHHLLTLVPCLDFDELDFAGAKTFENFVNATLLFRKTKHLETFRLTWEFCYDNSIRIIGTWLRHVIPFRPKVLEINIGKVEEMRFPSSMFTCATLESMFLSTKNNSLCNLITPKTINLPSLKSLKLGGLTLTNEIMKRLISACPVLEELILDSCYLQLTEISSLTLKRFKIDNCDFYTGIRICAPRLVHFSCDGFLWLDSIENMPAFEVAHIETAFYCSEVKLYGGFENAMELHFRGYCVQDILRPRPSLNQQIFRNLKSLSYKNQQVDDEDFKIINSFLRLTPNIKKLVLNFEDLEVTMAGNGLQHFRQSLLNPAIVT